MSKNLTVYIFITALLFAACKKDEDNVFKESPDERINKVLAEYNHTLTSAEYGWKGIVFPSALPTSPFSFYFKFDTLNRVQMFSDFDSTSFVTMRESSFRLKSLQQPSLLFDTYSYIHVLCDPDASLNGGYYGGGLLSDFEFAIDGINGDTINLTGRLHGSKAMLVKATSKEAQDYYDRKRNWDFENFSRFLTYFKQLHTANGDYDIYVNKVYRQIRLVNASVSFTTGYYYTPTGVSFSTPFNDGGKQTITALEDARWAPDQQQLTVNINGSSAKITSVIKPFVVDSAAPVNWYNTAVAGATYWITPTGFHIDGVDDAYNVSKTPGFAYQFYYPQFNSGYDYSGILEDSAYGPALKVKYNAKGTLNFVATGYQFGDIPDYNFEKVNNVLTKMTEATGYYFVQTSPSTYDMVNVKDARSWISWQLF